MQESLITLPPELWARVFSHLRSEQSDTELLILRRVCKSFSVQALSTLESFCPYFSSNSGGFLSLFRLLKRMARGRCAQPLSLDLVCLENLDDDDSEALLAFGASLCSLLQQSFKMQLVSLRFPFQLPVDALEVFLLEAPPCLTTLDMTASGELVSSSLWDSLSQLKSLSLWQSVWTPVPHVLHSASALSALNCLTHLRISRLGHLGADSLSLPSLRELHLSSWCLDHPLQSSLLPSLTKLIVMERKLPHVMTDSSMLFLLKIGSFRQMREISFSQLAITSLVVEASEPESIKLEQLLQLQAPESLEVTFKQPLPKAPYRRYPDRSCTELTRQPVEFMEALRRIKFALPHSSRWVQRPSDLRAASTPLLRNGHPIGCQCAACF